MHVKRLYRALMAVGLAAALCLTGCAKPKQPEKSPEKSSSRKQNGKSNAKGGGGGSEKQQDPMAKGAEQMQTKAQSLQDAVASGSTTDARKRARELDDAWEAIKPKVMSKNAPLHDQIESSMNKILAEAQLVPIDNALITAELNKLNSSLDQLKETKGQTEGDKKVDMKTGAAAMRFELSEVKKATTSGDTAKMQEHAKAADKVWSQFKDEAKEKSKDDYSAIEDSMHTLLAQVKESPVNKEKLTQVITKLDGELEKLTK
jgi:iron uptake system EfeUOB component EfeO/EfeM